MQVLQERVAGLDVHKDTVLASEKTIPGVNVTIATAVLAELGMNMDVFPSERHLASWAGLCPGHFESAGKKKSARMREGRTWLKYVLCEAAWGAVRTKGCYLSAKYDALRARRGSQRAIMAVAHKIVVAAYWILRTGEGFRDLGGDYLDKLHVERNLTVLARPTGRESRAMRARRDRRRVCRARCRTCAPRACRTDRRCKAPCGSRLRRARRRARERRTRR
jgi:transposase